MNKWIKDQLVNQQTESISIGICQWGPDQEHCSDIQWINESRINQWSQPAKQINQYRNLSVSGVQVKNTAATFNE